MIIKRDITPFLIKVSKQFPVVALMGPRQSGKTTLVKNVFTEYTYVNLENLDIRKIAKDDPRGFLTNYAQHKGLIIDEIQEVPELFSYLQEIVDKEYKPGFFIVTGSQNFLLYEKITQTLAGRIALLNLLPLSVYELKEANILPEQIDKLMIKGFYPRLYAQPIDPNTWISNYINTYVERDVRQIINVNNLLTFQAFLKLCAARTGSLINYAELARDCDISLNTAKAWISVLETSYIIKLVSPYYKNFSKRIIKSPKLYFFDTSLVCYLLGIKNEQDLYLNPIRGHIFESFAISELFKYSFNKGQTPNLYFWRDVQGHEIDAILEKSLTEIIPIEIKSKMTVSDDFFKGLIDWQKISSTNVEPYVIYSGNENFKIKKGNIFSWRNIYQMLEQIYK